MADKTPPKKGRPRGSGSFPWRAFFQHSTTPIIVLGKGRRLRFANPATTSRAYAFSRHELSESCLSFRPLSKSRAQGRPGARRTRGPVRNVHKSKCAHEHTGSAEASGLPCAMVLRLIRARPGETLLLCHHRQRQALACSRTCHLHRGGRPTRLRRPRPVHTSLHIPRPPHLHPRS